MQISNSSWQEGGVDQNIEFWRFYGLERDPFLATHGANLNEFSQWDNHFELLMHLIQYSNVLLTVIGQTENGKLSLVEQFSLRAANKLETYIITSKPDLDPIELLDIIYQAFEMTDIPTFEGDLSDQYRAVLDHLSAEKRKIVLLFEQADLLPEKTLEMCFHLIKQQFDEHAMLHLVLFGGRALETMLNKIAVREGQESLLHVITLKPFSLEETENYLRYCLSTAGLLGEIPFSSRDIKMIYREACGLLGPTNDCARTILIERAEKQQLPVRRVWRQYRLQILSAIIVVSAIASYAVGQYRDSGHQGSYEISTRVIHFKDVALQQPSREMIQESTSMESAPEDAPMVSEKKPVELLESPPIEKASSAEDKPLLPNIVEDQTEKVDSPIAPVVSVIQKKEVVEIETVKKTFNTEKKRVQSKRHQQSEHHPVLSSKVTKKPTVQLKVKHVASAKMVSHQRPAQLKKITPHVEQQKSIKMITTVTVPPTPVLKRNPPASLTVKASPVLEETSKPLQTVTTVETKTAENKPLRTNPSKKLTNTNEQRVLKFDVDDSDLEMQGAPINPDQLHSYQDDADLAANADLPQQKETPMPHTHAAIDHMMTTSTIRPQAMKVAAEVKSTEPQYGLQLMSSHDKRALERFCQQHHCQAQVQYVTTERDGKPWVLLIYGQYATPAQASKAIAELPTELKKLKPWPKKIK